MMKTTIVILLLLIGQFYLSQDHTEKFLKEYFDDAFHDVNENLKQFVSFKIKNKYLVLESKDEKISKIPVLNKLQLSVGEQIVSLDAESFIRRWNRKDINPLYLIVPESEFGKKYYRIGNTNMVLQIMSEKEIVELFKKSN